MRATLTVSECHTAHSSPEFHPPVTTVVPWGAPPPPLRSGGRRRPDPRKPPRSRRNTPGGSLLGHRHRRGLPGPDFARGAGQGLGGGIPDRRLAGHLALSRTLYTRRTIGSGCGWWYKNDLLLAMPRAAVSGVATLPSLPSRLPLIPGLPGSAEYRPRQLRQRSNRCDRRARLLPARPGQIAPSGSVLIRTGSRIPAVLSRSPSAEPKKVLAAEMVVA